MSDSACITYKQMCFNEGVKALERGHNYRLNAAYSVVLLSSSPYASYENKISPNGKTIERVKFSHNWGKSHIRALHVSLTPVR